MIDRRRRPRLSVVALLLLACGPEQSATDTDAPPAGPVGDGTGSAPAECPADLEPILTVEAYAEALAKALCARREACDCAEVPADCVAQATAQYLEEFAVPMAAGLELDPECAAKEVKNREWISCDIDSISPCVCVDFPGTLAEGAACEDLEGLYTTCAPGLLCNGGTCESYDAIPLVDEGEPCRTDTGKILGFCGADSLCHFEDLVCVPLPKLGDPCVDGFYCGPDQFCNNSDSSAGVCTDRLPAGSACGSSYVCEGFDCVDGVCADTPYICLAHY